MTNLFFDPSNTRNWACSLQLPHLSAREQMHLFSSSSEETNQKHRVLNTLSIRIRAGGPWRLLYVLGYVKQHPWVGTIHGCKPAMLSSSRNPLHSQNKNCAPAGETDNPGATEPNRGLIPGPSSLVGLMHLHGNHSDKLPTALPTEAPGFWAMDVSVRFQILSRFPATRVSSHRSKDHRQQGIHL